MSAQHLVLNLLGGVALLIWATRMVRTGILRAFGENLRHVIGRATHNRWTACLAGVAVAASLQSSAAAGLLVVSFAERGLIALAPALAVMLGADIGSTLVVQAMAVDLKALVPLFLVGGVAAFMISASAVVRQIGRIMIGLALMILALGLIVTASEPLRSNWLLAMVLRHLADSPILALALSAGLTWLVHSSVATVLLFVSLAAAGVLELALALTMVLGANVGSGLIPLGMSFAAGATTRRVLIGNLAFRLLGALAALAVVEEAASALARFGDPARQLALFHTGFNILLALVFLPLTGRAAALLERFVTQDKAPAADRRPEHLDDTLLDRPAMALSGATREVMRLADTVELMLREAIHPFEDRDDARREELRRLDSAVDRLQEEIKLYLTKLTRGPLSPEDSRRAFDLILFITNLEHVGDIIDKNLLVLAAKKQRLGLSFSPEGWNELRALHGLAVEQMRLAVTVFVTRDPDLARQLVEAKEKVRGIEKEATENHLRRLREGAVASIETSSVHLDMLRDLKRIIAHLTTVAHPILEETGELRESRLRGRAVPAGTEGPADTTADAPRPAPGPV